MTEKDEKQYVKDGPFKGQPLPPKGTMQPKLPKGYEKYRPRADSDDPAPIILVHPMAGYSLRLDPRKFGPEKMKTAKKEGWEVYAPVEDGFRKRQRGKKTRKEIIAEKIKSGEVADPNVGPQPHQEYPDDVFVIGVPLGNMSGAGQETQ